jgi:hypothetical protein
MTMSYIVGGNIPLELLAARAALMDDVPLHLFNADSMPGPIILAEELVKQSILAPPLEGNRHERRRQAAKHRRAR